MKRILQILLAAVPVVAQFSIPEILYDMDFPGHYQRKVKNVSVTVPCVVPL